MAAVSFPTTNALTVKLWAKRLAVEALKETWASRFMGKDDRSIIQIRDETRKSPGDKITYGLRMQMVGAGVIGDGTLEGNEEAPSIYSDAVIIDQLRHAGRSAGRMSQQRVPFDIREEILSGLRDWWSDRLDWSFFNQACGNILQTDTRWTGNQATIVPDANHYLNAQGGTDDSSLTSANTFSLTMIDKCVERAKTLTPPIRPVKIKGDEYYVMVLHPYQVTDMRTNTSTGQWEDLQKALMTGGVTKDNPVFTGALGIYNGTILHADIRVSGGFNAGTSVAVANTRRSVFLGAQAVMCAYGRDGGSEQFTWVEELFDYENQAGVAAGLIYGMKKTVFNSADFAVITASSYAAAH